MHTSDQMPAWFRYPRYQWQNKHAVVIGAGIAGCQMAWHLSQKGWQITLIERHEQIASEASGNPAGVISPKMTARPSSGEDFYVASFNYTLDLLEKLKQQSQKLDWNACGLLQIAHNQREESRWSALKDREFLEDFIQLLDKESTNKIAGIPLNYKASFIPKAGWINPRSFCEALIVTSNCKKILASEAISLEKQNNDWHVLDHQGQSIANAEVVIITNGKDLNGFTQTRNLPTMPVAGQTTVATASDYSRQLKTAIGHEGYLTPASDNTGQLTFGASFERNVNEVSLSPEADKQNLEQLWKYLPQLADSFIDISSAHAAIRMTTPDRFPYVGGLPDTDFYLKNYDDLHQGKKWKTYPDAQYQQGLFVFGGFGSRGLTTSGLCAKLLTDILDNDLDIKNREDYNKLILQRCHPARFTIKKLKTG